MKVRMVLLFLLMSGNQFLEPMNLRDDLEELDRKFDILENNYAYYLIELGNHYLAAIAADETGTYGIDGKKAHIILSFASNAGYKCTESNLSMQTMFEKIISNILQKYTPGSQLEMRVKLYKPMPPGKD